MWIVNDNRIDNNICDIYEHHDVKCVNLLENKKIGRSVHKTDDHKQLQQGNINAKQSAYSYNEVKPHEVA